MARHKTRIGETTLATLKQGEIGVIESVDTTDPAVHRLMVLGLVEGAEVSHSSSALGGDPIEFNLFGCGISLRQNEAKHFKIALTAAGG